MTGSIDAQLHSSENPSGIEGVPLSSRPVNFDSSDVEQTPPLHTTGDPDRSCAQPLFGAAGPSGASTHPVATFQNDGGRSPAVGGRSDCSSRRSLIGASAAVCLDNLKAAVNKDAGHGTLFFAAAAHTQFTATTNTDTTQLFVASVGASSGAGGNGLAVSDTSATLTWSVATLVGGLDGTLGNELIDSVNLADTDEDGLIQNLTFRADAEVITGGNSLILSIRPRASATTDVKNVDIDYNVI